MFIAIYTLILIGIVGCFNDPMSAENEGGSESSGEHAGNEDGEGFELGEEHTGNEGSEGSEGGENAIHQEEGSQQLALNQGYDQVRNGARLTIAYASQSNAFVGTVENTTSQILRRVRVEVHLSNGANVITAELGPTTPTDLKPGEQLSINLSAVGQVFNDWSPHVESGSGEGGEGSEDGSESGEEHAGNEGSEGSESSGHAEGGESGGSEGGESGDPSSPVLELNQSWDGVVNGIRVAMSYDPVKRAFSGIVENTTAQTICFVQIELNLKQGTRTVVELGPAPVGDLARGAQATTELLVADEPLAVGVAFDAWEIHPEMFDCNGPGPSSAGGEGSGEGSEGSESGEEHAEGGEGGEG
jgi:hypothetical protein